MKFEGTSAVVSGGAGGLGEATVRAMVEGGTHVVIADLNDEGGSALEKDLDGRATYLRTSVLDDEQVEAALAAAQEHGTLRLAVAAHGGAVGGRTGRIVDRDGNPASLDGFRNTIELFLTGTYNLLRLSAAAMVKGEPDENGVRGLVVNTASIAGYEGQIGQSAYSAAKGGVIGLTLVAARDLSAAGVRVMTIAPGTMATPAFRMPIEEADAKWGPGVPFPKRMGRPHEYGRLVRHFFENDYLNGEVVRLDGALRFGLK